mmetsp:Transcript_30136/g.70302  ORF Transcript_30136/g.70302 Transcript_30136/m.70302 type:complete len:428 (-) Transcript_30136:34-1317(-)
MCSRSWLFPLAILAEWSVGASISGPSPGDYSFLAVGDWGGLNDHEPTTPAQVSTAHGLAEVGKHIEPQESGFVLMLGDNFYDQGIQESCTASSPRFQETFEDVYAAVPQHKFYIMAGNHDYGEGVPSNVSAQVAYSSESSRWVFPALWYDIQRNFTVQGVNRSLQIFVTDSIVLCGIEEIPAEYIDDQLAFLGIPSGEHVGDVRKHWAEVQWKWLEDGLAKSTADYLWVTGHFPIWSAGLDGPTHCLVDRLRPLLKTHGAHYVSGHDHNLQHFLDEGLNTFVVGIGKECCYEPIHATAVPAGSTKYLLAGEHGRESIPAAPFPVYGGFSSFHLGPEETHVQFHAHNGTVLYTSQPILRRGMHQRHGGFLADVASVASKAAVGTATVSTTTPWQYAAASAFSVLVLVLLIPNRRSRPGGSMTEPLLQA